MITTLIALNKIDKFVFDAINSVVEQKINVPHEVLIIANGEEYESVAKWLENNFKDKVKICCTPIGQLSHALNLGLSCAKYNLIARMDADDISIPNRLQLNLEFMQENNLDMVGSYLTLINEHDEIIGHRKYPKAEGINKALPFRNPFAHNTILIKKEVILKARGYNSGFNSEDYDLWFRLYRQGIKWDNMDLELVKYRIHSAASQRRLLGYAESTGLAMREFILNKTLMNFLAVFYHFLKSCIRARKD